MGEWKEEHVQSTYSRSIYRMTVMVSAFFVNGNQLPHRLVVCNTAMWCFLHKEKNVLTKTVQMARFELKPSILRTMAGVVMLVNRLIEIKSSS